MYMLCVCHTTPTLNGAASCRLSGRANSTV